MANYAISNSTNGGGGGTSQAITTTYKSLVTTGGATSSPRRGKLYDLLIGTNGTPADNVMQFDIQRNTTTVTGTAVTPNPLDPADAAATTVVNANNSAQPTITSNSDLFYIGLNQRASYRWVCAPGSELVWPATTSNGLTVLALSPAYTGTATATILFLEQ